MSAAKHTPGPWRVTAIPAGNSSTIMLNGSAGFDLVDVTGNDQPANPADVRLMAAVPELLEALRDCERVLSDLPAVTEANTRVAKAYVAARAAIAKATA